MFWKFIVLFYIIFATTTLMGLQYRRWNNFVVTSLSSQNEHFKMEIFTSLETDTELRTVAGFSY